jgi:hypothetical protein
LSSAGSRVLPEPINPLGMSENRFIFSLKINS